MAFSPDGATLATTGGEDKRIRLWSVDAAQPRATLAGHLWDVVSVAFSPDGTTLASGSGDATVRLWAVDSGLHSATLEGHADWVHAVAFSPDGQTGPPCCPATPIPSTRIPGSPSSSTRPRLCA